MLYKGSNINRTVKIKNYHWIYDVDDEKDDNDDDDDVNERFPRSHEELNRPLKGMLEREDVFTSVPHSQNNPLPCRVEKTVISTIFINDI